MWTLSQFDDFQVPSLVAYEGDRPIAFGADALEYAEVDGVFIAKWFKLQQVYWACMAQPSLTTQLARAVCTLIR